MNGIIEWIMNIIIGFFSAITFWKDWDTFSLVFAVGLLVLIFLAYHFLKEEYGKPIKIKRRG